MRIAGLEFHEAADVFPRMSGPELVELTESIREFGVWEPVRYVMHPERGKQYIDGANRVLVASQLGRSWPEEEFTEGDPPRCPSDSRILDYVYALNKERRHLSSSQRAACAIKAGTLQKRYRAKERAGLRTTDNPDRLAPEGEDLPASLDLTGDQASRVATENGTNRAYLFKMATVAEKAPHLVDEVRDGKKSVEVAYAEAVGPPPVTDATGEPVPEKLVPVFRDRERFVDLQGMAGRLLAGFLDLLDSPGGLYLANFRPSLEQVVQTLKQNEPHAVCPLCQGSGQEKGKGKRPRAGWPMCQLCVGNGWVDRARWLRAKAVDDKEPALEGAK